MKKITPFLWFNNQAEEALNFYVSVFPGSKIEKLTFYGAEGPGKQGTVKSCRFLLMGEEFLAIDGGPGFVFTPAISFVVNCDTQEEADALWEKLSAEGEVLTPLDHYALLRKYGWIRDKYGITWQLEIMSSSQKIMPLLLFTGKQNRRAEDAMVFYAAVFEDAQPLEMERYIDGELGDPYSVRRARLLLVDQELMVTDSNIDSAYLFTPAISLFVDCKTQAEIDKFWEKLSADGGEKGMCGWLTDQFGVSWQVVPSTLVDWINDPNPVKSQRVIQGLLAMRKLDIEDLRKAYEGRE
jgi:predicted 3-demethylubiquinone-9 3-methyltransferase (glyoxalase superfamily)